MFTKLGGRASHLFKSIAIAPVVYYANEWSMKHSQLTSHQMGTTVDINCLDDIKSTINFREILKNCGCDETAHGRIQYMCHVQGSLADLFEEAHSAFANGAQFPVVHRVWLQRHNKAFFEWQEANESKLDFRVKHWIMFHDQTTYGRELYDHEEYRYCLYVVGTDAKFSKMVIVGPYLYFAG